MLVLKTIVNYLSLKLQVHLVFRTDAITNFVRGLLRIAVVLLFFEVIYNYVDTIAGWQKGEVFVLAGTVGLLETLHTSFFRIGTTTLSVLIRYGRLEKYLIQPISTPLMVALREPRFDSLYRLPSDIFIMSYGFYILGKFPSILDLPGFAVSLLLSLVIFTLMNFALTSIAFWVIEMNNLYWILYDLYEFARYPEKIYKGFISGLFLTLLPFIVLANFPTKFLLPRGHPSEIGVISYQFLLLILFFLIAKAVWRKGLKRYEGATL